MPVAKVLTRNWGRADVSLEAYEAVGGYRALRKALAMTPDAVTEEVKRSNLRGRGGAGFPTGNKWSFLPKEDPAAPKPRYLCVNADESEPGTFKDRACLENEPHQVIEGAIITAYAVGCHTAYVYIRGEFKREAEIFEKAIAEAYRAG